MWSEGLTGLCPLAHGGRSQAGTCPRSGLSVRLLPSPSPATDLRILKYEDFFLRSFTLNLTGAGSLVLPTLITIQNKPEALGAWGGSLSAARWGSGAALNVCGGGGQRSWAAPELQP